MPCRIGFVGAGGVATRHARMLSALDDVQLVSVTDPAPGRAGAFAETFGARVAPGLPQLLSTGIDAVYVCVPPSAHGPVEEAVVAAGLAMFVEKPLAVDEATADRVAAAVRRAGTITAVGHHWRYGDTIQRAQRLLEGRPVRLLAGSWLDKTPPVDWWTRRQQSGGQVIEQAVHLLDLARLFAGEVTDVCAAAGGRLTAPGADIDAATAAVLRFAAGAVGTLTATCVLPSKHHAGLDVYADGFILNVTETALWFRDGDTDPQHLRVDPDAAKRAADLAFVNAVRGARDDIRTGYEEALRTHRLACAIARSAELGVPVQPGAGCHAGN